MVGITGNAQNDGLGGRIGPEYFVVRRHTADDVIFRYPDAQRMSIVARSVIDSPTVSRELRDAVATLDPTLPVEVSTLRQTVSMMAARPVSTLFFWPCLPVWACCLPRPRFTVWFRCW